MASLHAWAYCLIPMTWSSRGPDNSPPSNVLLKLTWARKEKKERKKVTCLLVSRTHENRKQDSRTESRDLPWVTSSHSLTQFDVALLPTFFQIFFFALEFTEYEVPLPSDSSVLFPHTAPPLLPCSVGCTQLMPRILSSSGRKVPTFSWKEAPFPQPQCFQNGHLADFGE